MHDLIRKVHRARSYRVAGVICSGFVLGLAMSLLGCKDLTGNAALPAGTTNPIFYNTKQGAMLERNTALVSFFHAFAKEIIDVGLLTDELQDPFIGASTGFLLADGPTVRDPLDERILGPQSGGGAASYGLLQGSRGFTSQALGMLATYDTAPADLESQTILRSELYSVLGYAEIMLADLFCSGVPLSTLDFERDYTYHASSTRDQVYQTALAQFDTALILADTSTQLQNLARVGRGRAWLDLGQYDSAAAVVQSVPDGFRYQLSGFVSGSGHGINGPYNWDQSCGGSSFNPLCSTNTFTVSDREGSVGLPFIASGDPRSAGTVSIPSPVVTDSMLYFPRKYRDVLTTGTLTVTVASGVEARLIEAERALKAGDASWLTSLKRLHDTLPGVLPLTDPGSDSARARVALLFRERAEWLYLTGSRQGDLRRLLRQYPQYWPTQDLVYPRGSYRAPGAGAYGSDVTVPIPLLSESANPLFHGCFDRDP